MTAVTASLVIPNFHSWIAAFIVVSLMLNRPHKRLNLVSSHPTGLWLSSCLAGWASSNRTHLYLPFPDWLICFPLRYLNSSVSPISHSNMSMWQPYGTVLADVMSYWTYYFNPEQAQEKESRKRLKSRWRCCRCIHYKDAKDAVYAP